MHAVRTPTTNYKETAARAPANNPLPDAQPRPSPTPTTIMIISSDFRAKLRNGYKSDPAWARIIQTLDENLELDAEDQTGLPFKKHDSLLWETTSGAPERLRMPNLCKI